MLLIIAQRMPFQSTPSTRRETAVSLSCFSEISDFNPLPPHGGRPGEALEAMKAGKISIHSLHTEGDGCSGAGTHRPHHFNPLPPHGGRLRRTIRQVRGEEFQSTPSTRRETLVRINSDASFPFQSTPSTRRETLSHVDFPFSIFISIHSLHTEGDSAGVTSYTIPADFNPLPPHGGRPPHSVITSNSTDISIHSLHTEGDRNGTAAHGWSLHFNPLPPPGGRHHPASFRKILRHFNPLPPHGGRPLPRSLSLF